MRARILSLATHAARQARTQHALPPAGGASDWGTAGCARRLHWLGGGSSSTSSGSRAPLLHVGGANAMLPPRLICTCVTRASACIGTSCFSGCGAGGRFSSSNSSSSSGGARPGDWTCSACSASNFAARSACFKCGVSSGGGEPVMPDIPFGSFKIAFLRSQGKGGQNVNKVSSQVEMRFNAYKAPWLDKDSRDRLVSQQANRINKAGELVVASQEHRTQHMNRSRVEAKITEMVAEALVEPKVRESWVGIGKAGKAKRKVMKKRRSDTKKNRKVGKGALW